MARPTTRNVTLSVTNSPVPGQSDYKVISNRHAVKVYADKTTWDTTADVAVLPEDTNLQSGK